MIEFMVIGLPRSGTTWASNWLTTDATLCMHDPLATIHYKDWDHIKSNRVLGIADTGIQIFHEWLNKHPARKIILHRDKQEIAKSLGMTDIGISHLERINGIHCNWMDIFDNPKPIYEYLLQKEFDSERHFHLKNIRMQPCNEEMSVNKNLVLKIIDEIKELNHA